MDYLLLHCEIAYELWSEVSLMFGIQWVMLDMVACLLFGWKNCFGKHSSGVGNLVSETAACLSML